MHWSNALVHSLIFTEEKLNALSEEKNTLQEKLATLNAAQTEAIDEAETAKDLAIKVPYGLALIDIVEDAHAWDEYGV